MASGNWTTSSRRTISAYFADGEDAHRAINDLLAEGFRSRDIGAAFHSGNPSASSPAAEEERDLRPAVGPNAPGAGSTTSGAASDSSAVTPAGLSTGGGTPTSGPDRPGPIPGGEIPSTLPRSIPSTLPSTLHPSASAPVAAAPTANDYPATGGFHEMRTNTGTNWWEKLKHVFGSDDPAASGRSPVADKSSTNFGTGEGHLGAYPDYDVAYSGEAFESAFFGMGIPSAQARQLSGSIRRGGAIVTVDADARSADAERIMERNRGTVRSDATNQAGDDGPWESNREGRVQIFGQVLRVYPGYVSSSGAATRKAS